LFPERIDDYDEEDSVVRVIDPLNGSCPDNLLRDHTGFSHSLGRLEKFRFAN